MDKVIEFFIAFVVGIVFNCIQIRYRDEEGNIAIISGVLAGVSWFACGPLFLGASPSVYGLAWLFFILGIVSFLLALESVVKYLFSVLMGRNRRSDLFE